MPAFIDLTGLRFGRLHVERQADSLPNQRVYWLCVCDCGEICVTQAKKLRSGHTKSCGCLRKPHGESSPATPEYNSWKSMLNRCYRKSAPDYSRYGGRGVTVCERWKDFENFLADMGRRPTLRHTLDRKDNAGNYESINCRWATATEQNNNKRLSVFVTVAGETLTVAQWAARVGKNRSTLYNRIDAGRSAHEIVYGIHTSGAAGEKNGNAKLTAEDIVKIRADTRLLRIIASDYGVFPQNISRIKKLQRWAHI